MLVRRVGFGLVLDDHFLSPAEASASVLHTRPLGVLGELLLIILSSVQNPKFIEFRFIRTLNKLILIYDHKLINFSVL